MDRRSALALSGGSPRQPENPGEGCFPNPKYQTVHTTTMHFVWISHYRSSAARLASPPIPPQPPTPKHPPPAVYRCSSAPLPPSVARLGNRQLLVTPRLHQPRGGTWLVQTDNTDGQLYMLLWLFPCFTSLYIYLGKGILFLSLG